MTEQLTLPINKPANMSFANFYTGNNVEIINILKNITNNKNIFIAGDNGTGKTHLLMATIQYQAESYAVGQYINMQQANWKYQLSNCDPAALICIDDLQFIISDHNKQEILFHLFNQVADNNGNIIFAASMSPKQLHLPLADLTSRLTWGIVYQLQHLPEPQVSLALQNAAFELGITIPTEVMNFLLTRCSRKIADLLAILKVLDQASLAEQRKLTIPFVKDVLGI